MSRSRLEVRVDRDLCMGSGSCAFHAPETFDLDDDMKVLVLAGRDADDPTGSTGPAGSTHPTGSTGPAGTASHRAVDSDDAVTAAVGSCPSGALRFAARSGPEETACP
jgi:ferredoxin